MARSKLKNYVRSYRKRTGFSQNEIAYLLGSKSGAKVSRYECFNREPRLKTVFAYEAVFGVPTQKLFGGVQQEAQKRTVKRAKLLAQKLSRKPQSRETACKLEALLAIVSKNQPHGKRDEA